MPGTYYPPPPPLPPRQSSGLNMNAPPLSSRQTQNTTAPPNLSYPTHQQRSPAPGVASTSQSTPYFPPPPTEPYYGPPPPIPQSYHSPLPTTQPYYSPPPPFSRIVCDPPAGSNQATYRSHPPPPPRENVPICLYPLAPSNQAPNISHQPQAGLTYYEPPAQYTSQDTRRSTYTSSVYRGQYSGQSTYTTGSQPAYPPPSTLQSGYQNDQSSASRPEQNISPPVKAQEYHLPPFDVAVSSQPYLTAPPAHVNPAATPVPASEEHVYYPPPEPQAQKPQTENLGQPPAGFKYDYYYPPPSAVHMEGDRVLLSKPPMEQVSNTTDGAETAGLSDEYYYPAASEISSKGDIVLLQKPPVEHVPSNINSLETNNVKPDTSPVITLAQLQRFLQQDSLATLSTEMDKLTVNFDEVTSKSAIIKSNNRAQGPVPVRATGTPRDIVPCCPEDRIVDYSIFWYHLEDCPEFLICTKCHADHIQKTALEKHFIREKKPDGVASNCGFWYPRVKELLWPQALKSEDLTAMRAFMNKRKDILQCKGRNFRTATEGVKWYGMTNNEIDAFVICEACYMDRIMGSTFETNFVPFRQQPLGDRWSCDLSIPCITIDVAEKSKSNDWEGFVAASLQRLRMPKCEGREVELNSCNWYLPRQKIEGMHVCETCYVDKIATTPFENEFEQYVPGTGFDAFIERLGQRWTCNLATENTPMAFALDAAKSQHDFSVFWKAAEVITPLSPCIASGIIGGNWWTIKGGCDESGVCEACHAGIVKSLGVAEFFEPAHRDREVPLLCDFCPTAPRFAQYYSKFREAIDKGVFSLYADCVRKFAGIPACPGIDYREKARWWGYPEALFCEDCYLRFVSDTALGASVALKGELDDRAMCCQIWSPRMRKMWLDACNAGAPGSASSQAALEEFRAFGTRRMQVYNATRPQIIMIRGMQEMRMMNAMSMGMMGIMYQGANGIASVTGTTDGYLHGSSSLGWHETEYGAQSAQMFNNMQSGMAGANRMDEWMQLAQLEATWKEVE